MTSACASAPRTHRRRARQGTPPALLASVLDATRGVPRRSNLDAPRSPVLALGTDLRQTRRFWAAALAGLGLGGIQMPGRTCRRPRDQFGGVSSTSVGSRRQPQRRRWRRARTILAADLIRSVATVGMVQLASAANVRLGSGQTLSSGQSIDTHTGCRLTTQSDGDLVEYCRLPGSIRKV